MAEPLRSGTDLLAALDYIGISATELQSMCHISQPAFSSYVYHAPMRNPARGVPAQLWRMADKLTAWHDAEVDRVLKVALDDYQAFNGKPPELVRLVWMSQKEEHPDGYCASLHNAVMRDAAFEIEQEGIPVRFVRISQMKEGDIR